MVNGEWIGVGGFALIATQAPRANARVVLLPPRHRNWQAERMPTGHWVASLWVALNEVHKFEEKKKGNATTVDIY